MFPLFHILTPFLHERYLAVSGCMHVRNIKLTPREKECLRWAAEGKSSWEIGMILTISERTAINHLQNAGRKLQATNRVQAVARAVLYKLI
ncbi:MAG: helix-turn-helix transcriptional regulator [Magnetococcales bacterium]|nr:helix-turn-helix transcriptional regulator [Magnetococcales bacterium]